MLTVRDTPSRTSGISDCSPPRICFIFVTFQFSLCLTSLCYRQTSLLLSLFNFPCVSLHFVTTRAGEFERQRPSSSSAFQASAQSAWQRLQGYSTISSLITCCAGFLTERQREPGTPHSRVSFAQEHGFYQNHHSIFISSHCLR